MKAFSTQAQAVNGYQGQHHEIHNDKKVLVGLLLFLGNENVLTVRFMYNSVINESHPILAFNIILVLRVVTSSPIKSSVWIETVRCFLSVFVNTMEWQAFWTTLKVVLNKNSCHYRAQRNPITQKRTLKTPNKVAHVAAFSFRRMSCGSRS